MAGLDEQYLVGGGRVAGEFTVIGQIESFLKKGERFPALRVVRDTPPTTLEVSTLTTGMTNMIEPAASLGVNLTEDDIVFEYLTVALHPVAISGNYERPHPRREAALCSD